MKQKALFAGGFALILAAAFLVVRATSGVKAAENTPVTSQDVSQATRSTRLRSDGEARFSTRQRAGQRERSTAEPTEQMVGILSSVDPLTRAQLWLDFVNSLDPGEFEELADDMDAKQYARSETNF